MLQALPEFAAMYMQRPRQRNDGGGGVNHLFGLWFAVRQIKPKYIIESGVFQGQSTWVLRQAMGSNASILSFDPSSRTPTYSEDHSQAGIPGRNFFGSKF